MDGMRFADIAATKIVRTESPQCQIDSLSEALSGRLPIMEWLALSTYSRSGMIARGVAARFCTELATEGRSSPWDMESSRSKRAG
jgi:hypothetical protein